MFFGNLYRIELLRIAVLKGAWPSTRSDDLKERIERLVQSDSLSECSVDIWRESNDFVEAQLICYWKN